MRGEASRVERGEEVFRLHLRNLRDSVSLFFLGVVPLCLKGDIFVFERTATAVSLKIIWPVIGYMLDSSCFPSLIRGFTTLACDNVRGHHVVLVLNAACLPTWELW